MVAFKLTCVDCSFSEEIEGNVDDAFDRIEEHQASYDTDRLDHFVEFERLDDD